MVMQLLPTKDLFHAVLISIVKLGQIARVSVWEGGEGRGCTVGLHKAFQVCIFYLLSQRHSLEHQFIAKARFKP